MRLVVLTALVFSISLSSTGWTAETKKCKTLLEQLGITDPEVGFGWRGYVGYKAAATAENLAQAAKLGMMHWGWRIYTVSSVEEMIRHDALQPNELIKGAYLLTDYRIPDSLEKDANSDDPKIRAVARKTIIQKFKKIIKETGMHHVDENGVAQSIPAEFLKEAFNPRRVEVMGEVERSENIFYYRGWFAPKVKGVILSEDADPAVSETYKKLAKVSRSLIRKGNRVVFNTDYAGSLAMLGKQERFLLHLVTGERIQLAESANRYKDASVIQSEMKVFEEGHAFSVEVWSPEGELVAGSIGHISGNLYSPESIFYKKGFLDEAKMSIIALLDRLEDAGILFVDAGMRTPFTATMKGKYITRKQFLEYVASLPAEKRNVDFTTPWTPRPGKGNQE